MVMLNLNVAVLGRRCNRLLRTLPKRSPRTAARPPGAFGTAETSYGAELLSELLERAVVLSHDRHDRVHVAVVGARRIGEFLQRIVDGVLEVGGRRRSPTEYQLG